ncbi:MAG TPA: hypothetical protein V6C89_02440 [Drouetiella sp.]|jgi:hypothetical protein
MTFDKQIAAVSREAEGEHRLDFNTVCPDRAAVEHFSVGRTERKPEVQELLAANDEVVRQATESWSNILTKFDRLPPAYKEALLESFAPHMYGDNENYPMYNRLVDKHAQQVAERATLV